VGVSPLVPGELARVRDERGLRFFLLSDVDGSAAELCGVRYELTQEHIDFYRRHGITFKNVWPAPSARGFREAGA